MADFEPPSFSLGLDLDAESELRIPTQIHHPLNPAPDSSTNGKEEEEEEEEEEEFGAQVMDSDPEPGSGPPRILKRLRRGFVKKRESEPLKFDNGDDDIEEFSSQEDFIKDDHPPTQFHSVCSSSKVPLHGRGLLTTQTSSQWKVRRREQASDAPESARVEKGHNGSVFPKLTISPLRKFQLIDSDSDDPSGGEDISKKVHENKQQFTASEQRKKASVGKPQNEDLWKDFCPMKSLHIPTPALDEFCEEYSRSVKNKVAAQKVGGGVCLNNSEGCHQTTNNSQQFEQCWDLADPLPPAHHYFFHDDTRIQKLVRTRLPNFFPLGVVNRGNHQPSASVIDYMSQFTNGEASKQKGTQKTNSKKNSTRGRNKSKKSNAEEVLHASEGWVDPKSSTTIPRDAGKRRVHATGQSSWYTGPDGRKVYVSRSGQELTGQMAYRHYRKESGTGFRKSKKKTSAKKKKG